MSENTQSNVLHAACEGALTEFAWTDARGTAWRIESIPAKPEAVVLCVGHSVHAVLQRALLAAYTDHVIALAAADAGTTLTYDPEVATRLDELANVLLHDMPPAERLEARRCVLRLLKLCHTPFSARRYCIALAPIRAGKYDMQCGLEAGHEGPHSSACPAERMTCEWDDLGNIRAVRK